MPSFTRSRSDPAASWRERGLCFDIAFQDKDLAEGWVEEESEFADEAKAVCSRCEVRDICLLDALVDHQSFGMRAGYFFDNGAVTSEDAVRIRRLNMGVKVRSRTMPQGAIRKTKAPPTRSKQLPRRTMTMSNESQTASVSSTPSAPPKISIVEITPEIAVDLLTKNTHNRSVSQAAVAEYAKAMSEGRWLESGDTIRIAENGLVLDGQHRLYAIIESEKTQRMVLVEGLPVVAQTVMDTGRKRTFANALTILKEKDANHLASIVAVYNLWTKGTRGATLTSFGTVDGVRPQIPELMAVFDADKDKFREAARRAGQLRRAVPITGRVAGLVWILFSDLDEEDAIAFFDQLAKGNDLEEGDPIYTLRNRLFSDSRNKTAVIHPTYTLALVIKTWNLWRKGEKNKVLVFKAGGSAKEQFPEPV